MTTGSDDKQHGRLLAMDDSTDKTEQRQPVVDATEWPECIAQVDAWLAGRAPTALSRRWGIFVSTWWYEREKWPDDVHATEAAMCGILLALVVEAWGSEYSVCFNPEGMVEIMHIPTANVALYVDEKTGGFALAAALLAAPTKGDGR